MRVLIVIFVFWATAAISQSFPQYQSTTVNDYADLLSPDQEAELVESLTELNLETGVEMTVLTLGSQAAFAPDVSLETFATGLFNEWGIGDENRNDGVLVMVLRTDRVMRIELGAAYDHDWDLTAQRAIDRDFLPFFRNDDYGAGIVNGVDAVIDDIVLPFRAGEKSPVRAIEPKSFFGTIVAIIAGSIAAIVVIVRSFRGFIQKMRKCPQCGNGGLHKKRLITSQASLHGTGHGINRFQCDYCDYLEDLPFTISRIRTRSSGSSGGSFGGGRSGGGGASGRW